MLTLIPAIRYFSLKRTQELVVTVGRWHMCTEETSNTKIIGVIKAALPRQTWQRQGMLLFWGCWGPSRPELYNLEKNFPDFTFVLGVSNTYTSTEPSSVAHQSRKHPPPV